MQDAHGLDLAPARDQFADSDQRSVAVVHSHEAARVHRRRHDGGRLPMGEHRAARAVETNDGPAGQRRLDGAHARPEADLTVEELAPGPGVSESTRPLTPWVSVVSPKRTVARYSFSWSTRYGVSLVASPTSTGSTPVASGSSVPAWPIRRSPRRRRTIATTSNDVAGAPLSTTRIPEREESRVTTAGSRRGRA